MKSLMAAAAAMTSAAAFLAVSFTSATADTRPSLQNSQIDVLYVEPSNPAYRPIYERLKQRAVLEELREFLAPLRLEKKILVKLDQCNQPTRPFEPGGPVIICYECIAEIERLAPADRTPRGVSRKDAIVGAFVQVVLQGTSRAVLDALNAPVWGRLTDASDRLAAYLMLQFGEEVTRRTLIASTYFFEKSRRTWTGSDFSDVYSTEDQRFYNYLCVAYGSNQQVYKDLVQNDQLTQHRAERCRHEYAELDFAIKTVLMPYVDKAMLKEVLSRQWLRSDDGVIPR
jgi:hypothetical protein